MLKAFGVFLCNQLLGEPTMHVIRMRYPWQKRRAGDTDWERIEVPEPNAAEPDRAERDVPGTGDSDGPSEPLDESTNEYRRRFNRPTGLDASVRVLLCIEKWHGAIMRATVNGQDVSADGDRINADITRFLEDHNEILITLADRIGEPARLSGEVSLVICQR